MRRLTAIAALALAAGACAPAPSYHQACRDMCAHLDACGHMEVHDCGNAFCLYDEGDLGGCADSLRDYFVCVEAQACDEPSVWCRSEVTAECGGWL
jgi:hypothetical protein